VIKNKWCFAGGLGLLSLGPVLNVAADGHPDMIWEKAGFAVTAWLIGVVLLAVAVRETASGTDERT
jgi:hypothetical protein